MSLRKKSKIIIIVSLTILIIVFVYEGINIVVAHYTYLRDIKPDLYIVPVERKIADIENQRQENTKVNYDNLEIKLPCKIIIKKHFVETHNKLTMFITIDKDTDKGKGFSIGPSILCYVPPKDKKVTFERCSKMLYLTPDQVNKNDHENSLLLAFKPTSLFHRGGIYKFETSNIKGFQFFKQNNKVNKYTVVEIFDKNDNQYELGFSGFSQREIDYTLASIRIMAGN